jgi:hypothetical protein
MTATRLDGRELFLPGHVRLGEEEKKVRKKEGIENVSDA